MIKNYKIINEKINISDLHNKLIMIRTDEKKPIKYLSRIDEYVNKKTFNRIFIKDYKFENDTFEINIKDLYIGKVYHIKHQFKSSNKYSEIKENFFVVLEINDKDVIIDSYNTLNRAIKASVKYHVPTIKVKELTPYSLIMIPILNRISLLNN